MIVIGLTGSIGMGKSTVAAMCRRLRVPVDNADDAVHRLLAGKGYAKVAAAFPQAVRAGRIDRAALGGLVFADTEKLRLLESILHPLVAAQRAAFLARCRSRGCRMVVLDIPLLFEKRLEAEADCIVVVSSPGFVQRARVLSRPRMTGEKYRAILSRQMPDAEKRRRGDFVIRTGGPRGDTLKQLRRILNAIDSGETQRSRHARNRPRYRNHRA